VEGSLTPSIELLDRSQLFVESEGNSSRCGNGDLFVELWRESSFSTRGHRNWKKGRTSFCSRIVPTGSATFAAPILRPVVLEEM
jgi:hypothetical protein